VLPECFVAALAPKEDPPHLFCESNATVVIDGNLHPEIVTQLSGFPKGFVSRLPLI
jgi:hypothetical protein